MYPNLKNVKNLIAVASGKGGVGKSTVAVHLALALARSGAKVGLLDADVYGPSIPKMLAGTEKPTTEEGMVQPSDRYGVKFMSLGLFLGPETPVIWRGPLATKLIQQFLGDVAWGELDYLLIDLPPGTGDVQLTLTQSAPLTGAVIVTTPQDVAVDVTMRGVKMFEEVQVPILGVIENMSGFVCPHCDRETRIFGHGGGEKTAREQKHHFLGRIPIDPRLVQAGDEGRPVTEGPAAAAFESAARELVAQLRFVADRAAAVKVQLDAITLEKTCLGIRWADQTVTQVPYRDLRLACPCAQCVDEHTGKKVLKDSSIPADIRVVSYELVGRYGLQLAWSDGHGTGIHPLEKLRGWPAPSAPCKKTELPAAAPA